MKRFRFGLAPLLKVKEQRERLAEARVVQARQTVEEHREQIQRLHQGLAEASARLEAMLGSPSSAEVWTVPFEQSSRLERAIRDVEVALRRAEKILRHSIEARTRLSTEVEALETLRSEYLQVHREEGQRAEQNRLDEVVMRQWIQARRNGPGI